MEKCFRLKVLDEESNELGLGSKIIFTVERLMQNYSGLQCFPPKNLQPNIKLNFYLSP